MMLRITFGCILIGMLVVSCLTSPYLNDDQITEDPENPQTKNTTPNPHPILRIIYTENYEPQSTIRRGAVDGVVTESTTIFDLMSLINETIIKNKNDVAANLDKFINTFQIQSIGSNISNLTCNDKQYEYAGAFKESLKNWLSSIIIGKNNMLSNIQIDELPNMNGKLSNKTSVSDFKLTNIVIKGIENMTLLKYDMDLCEMSIEVELKVPNIQLTALYTLNGIIDDNPIKGDGKLWADIDDMYFYDRSFATCKDDEDWCRSRQKNKTSIANADGLKLNITGIKYKDYDELKINKKLNEYIKNSLELRVSPWIMNNLMDMLNQDQQPIDLQYFRDLKEDLQSDKPPRFLPYLNTHQILISIKHFFQFLYKLFQSFMNL